MRIFLLLVSLFMACQLHAQIVVTVAGVLESAGHEDGPVFESLFNNPNRINGNSVRIIK